MANLPFFPSFPASAPCSQRCYLYHHLVHRLSGGTRVSSKISCLHGLYSTHIQDLGSVIEDRKFNATRNTYHNNGVTWLRPSRWRRPPGRRREPAGGLQRPGTSGCGRIIRFRVTAPLPMNSRPRNGQSDSDSDSEASGGCDLAAAIQVEDGAPARGRHGDSRTAAPG